MITIKYSPCDLPEHARNRWKEIEVSFQYGHDNMEDIINAFRSFLFAMSYGEEVIDQNIVNPYGGNYMEFEKYDEDP